MTASKRPSEPTSRADLPSDVRVDGLYRVPLREFTPTRDRLARQLATEGDPKAAVEVKRRGKPSVPAWAANQVVWQASADWSRLRAAAAVLRGQHARPSSVEELRRHVHEQRDALRACEARAAELLQRHGHPAGPDVLQKVGGTLLALAHGAPGAEPGRVTRELQPPGFEVLTGLTLAAPAAEGALSEPPRPKVDAVEPLPAPKRPPHRQPSPAERRREAQARARRKAVLQAARVRLARARRALSAARRRLATEEARCRSVEQAWTAARAACEKARTRAQAAEQEAAATAAELRTLQDQPGG